MSDSDDEVVEKQFKIVLLGDPQTGKSSMATKYAQETFSKQYSPTVGVEFYLKRTVLPGPRNVAIKIWDVGGTALEGRMLDKYVYGANAILLVYDVSNFKSFENLHHWLTACKRLLSGSNAGVTASRPPIFAIVANKIDLEHMRVVKAEQHHKFAQENSLLTYAVSAKSGEGLSLCFQKVAAELLGIRLSKAEQEQHQTVVKAEIITQRPDRVQANPQSNVKTTICNIQ